MSSSSTPPTATRRPGSPPKLRTSSGGLPADRALRVWMSQVLDYLAAKHGMADTLKTLPQNDEQLSSQTR
ncbi:MAG: hypothetical protein QOE54_5124 [Streptosporangiaceae bacterium]|nr:hypothetical protein [Streptosporangiaceae bacterium]